MSNKSQTSLTGTFIAIHVCLSYVCFKTILLRNNVTFISPAGTSITTFNYHFIPLRVTGGWKPVPAAFRQEAGYNLDKLPGLTYTVEINHSHSHLHLKVSLVMPCHQSGKRMSLDWRTRTKHPETTAPTPHPPPPPPV